MTVLVIAVWMGLAVIGLYFAWINGRESLADYHALGGKQNGRRTIAVGNLRREIVRGLISFDFLILGVLALLEVRGVVVPGLILASAGMALNSWLDRRDRLYLMENGMQSRDDQGRFTKEN